MFLLFLQESQSRLSYLLESYSFTQEDITLNCTVLNWPKDIGPIFDENDEVIRGDSRVFESSSRYAQFFLTMDNSNIA